MRNKDLLEATSELDSEVARQESIAASWEAQATECELRLQLWESELSEQRLRHRSVTGELHREIADREEDVRQMEREAAQEDELQRRLRDAVDRIRAECDAETAELQRVRQANERLLHEETERDAAVLAGYTGEIRDVESRRTTAHSEMSTVEAKSRKIEAELAEERVRRDELGSQLRKAVAEQATLPAKLRELEKQVAARGGDPKLIIEEAAQGRGVSAADELAAANRTAELREELTKVEAKRNDLQRQVDEKGRIMEQTQHNLQQSLDDARTEIQRKLVEAASKQQAEVQQLERETAEYQVRTQEEAHETASIQDAIKELQRKRLDARRQRELDEQRAKDEAVQCEALETDIGRLRGRTEETERATALLRAQSHEIELQIQEVNAEGEKKCAKVRNMIDELWTGIRAQAAQNGLASGSN